MKKKMIIRLTESELHKIVKESVGRMLNELNYSDMPINADYNARQKFFGDAIAKEFPGYQQKPGEDLGDAYFRLAYGAKADEDARRERALKKKEREALKQEELEEWGDIATAAEEIVRMKKAGTPPFEIYDYCKRYENEIEEMYDSTEILRPLARKALKVCQEFRNV